MRRIYLILLLISLIPIKVLADNKIQFSLNDIVINSEEEINVELSISDNPGFGYLGLEIAFDENNLEYISSDLTGFDNALMKGAVINNDNNLSVYALQVDNSKLITDNGAVLKIKFKRKSNFLKTDLKIINISVGKDENTAYDYEVKDSEIKMKIEEKVNINDTVNVEEEINQYLEDKEIDSHDIEWSSDNENVLEIDENGNVLFKNQGTATIKGILDDQVIYEKTYVVKNKSNYYVPIIFIFIFILVLICILGFIMIRKRSKLKNKLRTGGVQ